MKGIVLFLLTCCLGISGFSQGFVVRELAADIYLHSEGYFDVVENYQVEFTEPKHGVFREIITEYKLKTAEGKTEERRIFIQNLDVPGHKFEVSSKIEQNTEGKLVIKIGDEDKLVNGLQRYEIKYRVYNAFLFEDSVVQFYWNIKPTGWPTIFQRISFRVHTPENLLLSAANCFAYAGYEGDTAPSTAFNYTYANGLFSGASHAGFWSGPQQAVTVLLKLPRNAIQENFIRVSLWWRYGWLGVIAALFIAFWLVWRKYGKDDRVVAAISYYPPKNIDPAMAGYLINDRDDTSDLMSFLPYWASQGLISIEEIPKKNLWTPADMRLKKLKDLPPEAADYERKIFNGLFGNVLGSLPADLLAKIEAAGVSYGLMADSVLISSLKNTFYTTMNAARSDLKAKAQKYYEAKSNFAMNVTMAMAILAGVVLCPLFLYTWGAVAAVSGAIAGVSIAFLSFFMRKKNSQGNVVFSELKGFRQFIKVAEVNRLQMLLKEDPHYFESTMSYALAFGLLDQWAEKFDALDMAAPSWYTSNGTNSRSMRLFSRSFSGSMKQAGSSMVSAPSKSSSSGGGSSGGGFGGGGGGSW